MPTLSKRKRSAVAQEESPVDSNDEVQADSDNERQGSLVSLEDLAKRLVRHALACEVSRKPMTRTEAREKVYNGAAGLSFKKIFDAAQNELRTVFAMEMTEMPAREKITIAQKRAAQMNDAVKPATSWMLTSILPPGYHDPKILPSSRTTQTTQESVYIAIYSMIVGTISLNRGTLPDSKLDRYLTMMGLADQTPVDGYEKPDQLLKRMQKDGYIVKVTESIGSGEEEITWVLGPRGKLEVGDAGVKGLVEVVYGDVEDGNELARKIERNLGIKERTTQAPVKRQRKARKQSNTGAEVENDDDMNNEDDEDD